MCLDGGQIPQQFARARVLCTPALSCTNGNGGWQGHQDAKGMGEAGNERAEWTSLV